MHQLKIIHHFNLHIKHYNIKAKLKLCIILPSGLVLGLTPLYISTLDAIRSD